MTAAPTSQTAVSAGGFLPPARASNAARNLAWAQAVLDGDGSDPLAVMLAQDAIDRIGKHHA